MIELLPVILYHIFHSCVLLDWIILIGRRMDANRHCYLVVWALLLMHILMHRSRLQTVSSCWALEVPVIPEISFLVIWMFLGILDSIQMSCFCQEDHLTVLWCSHNRVWTGGNNFQIWGMTWHFWCLLVQAILLFLKVWLGPFVIDFLKWSFLDIPLLLSKRYIFLALDRDRCPQVVVEPVWRIPHFP